MIKAQSFSPVQQILATLQAQGFSGEAATALMALDAENFRYVRRVQKGDVPRSLMRELGTDLEATHLQALGAVLRIECGHGRDMPQEVTVGLLAEEMNLDPSRASRIAADLVEKGLVLRAVSQEDGRRSVLVTTQEAGALMDAFLRAKWQRTMRLFEDWPEDDIISFAKLFARYVEGMREQYPGQTSPG
jgi:DNA-binding MarR family transcriptional regulator